MATHKMNGRKPQGAYYFFRSGVWQMCRTVDPTKVTWYSFQIKTTLEEIEQKWCPIWRTDEIKVEFGTQIPQGVLTIPKTWKSQHQPTKQLLMAPIMSTRVGNRRDNYLTKWETWQWMLMSWWRNIMQWKKRKKMHSGQPSRWKKAQGGKYSLHPATQATKIQLHYPQLLKSSIQAAAMSYHQFQGWAAIWTWAWPRSVQRTQSQWSGNVFEIICSPYEKNHKEYHAHYSQDERTMLCGSLFKNTNLWGNHNWWLEMQRVVIKTHTDVWNNAIKNMQRKFKGKPKQGNILEKVWTSLTNLCSSLCIQKFVIRAQGDLVGTPSTVDAMMTQCTSWKWGKTSAIMHKS